MHGRGGGRAALVLASAVLLAAPAYAADLGANPTECEIQAALLGTPGDGCPAPAPRPPATVPYVEPAPAQPTAHRPAEPSPVTVPQPELSASFLITFDFASTTIAAPSRLVLDRVAAVMVSAQAKGKRFLIVGHTDGVGSDVANLALSLRRATAVRDYFIKSFGIAANRLEVEGRGKSRLADPAHPGSAVNRRVEIITLGG